MRQLLIRSGSRLCRRRHYNVLFHLSSRTHPPLHRNARRPLSSSSSSVRIGNVEIPLGRPPLGEATTPVDDRWLIPHSFLPSDTQSLSSSSSSSPAFLRHLQWMMAKDLLQQDMLLVGPPGAGECYRRRLALAYAEMTQKPIEILTISGDMTESDLKQRRELVQTVSNDNYNNSDTNHANTSVQFVDQAPVRAAKYGRLLLLDGLEKAERNVLPTLNNLLENREMYLEDGTLLLPPHRVEELSNDDGVGISSSSSSSWIPVHPDFRVIALGVPSPPFPGRSLDPPIRSRFQIRRIDNPNSEQLYESIVLDNGLNDRDDSNKRDLALAKSCAVLAGATDDNDRLFPSNHLGSIWRVLRDFPAEHPINVLRRAFPTVKSEQLKDWTKHFGSSVGKASGNNISEYGVKRIDHGQGGATHAIAILEPLNGLSTETSSINVCTGNELIRSTPNIKHTDSFRRALAAMMQEHGSGRDILLLSPKGEGKNALAQEFAILLGFETHLFAIYSEMSSQDLLLRRGTDSSTGETIWDETPLLRAARRGDVCILDGIEKLRPDVLSSIQR